MNQKEAMEQVRMERQFQDKLYPRDERRRQMYSFIPPHIVLLERQIQTLGTNWYAGNTDECIKNLVEIAAIAVRALEEVKT
jgi:hypothetical protein